MQINKLTNIKQYYKNYKLNKKMKKLSKEGLFWNVPHLLDISYNPIFDDNIILAFFFEDIFNNYYNNDIRQNIINDNTFKKSLYIKTLEKEFIY